MVSSLPGAQMPGAQIATPPNDWGRSAEQKVVFRTLARYLAPQNLPALLSHAPLSVTRLTCSFLPTPCGLADHHLESSGAQHNTTPAAKLTPGSASNAAFLVQAGKEGLWFPNPTL